MQYIGVAVSHQPNVDVKLATRLTVSVFAPRRGWNHQSTKSLGRSAHHYCLGGPFLPSLPSDVHHHIRLFRFCHTPGRGNGERQEGGHLDPGRATPG
jgi:hypothetical protein